MEDLPRHGSLDGAQCHDLAPGAHRTDEQVVWTYGNREPRVGSEFQELSELLLRLS